MAICFNMFVIKDDLKKIFSEYEKTISVKYYKCGAFENNEKSTVKSMLNYKNLGTSINGTNNDNKYLVMKANNTCKFNEIASADKKVKYYIDDIRNKKTFTIDLQGIFEDKLVKTTVSTIYDNDNELFKIFKEICNKYCVTYNNNNLIGLSAKKIANKYQLI